MLHLCRAGAHEWGGGGGLFWQASRSQSEGRTLVRLTRSSRDSPELSRCARRGICTVDQNQIQTHEAMAEMSKVAHLKKKTNKKTNSGTAQFRQDEPQRTQ